ncbi:MAG: aminotransferase class I/II-fold pyridoxal phosphate-dependent enzyme, partial [Sphingopyxis sp.]
LETAGTRGTRISHALADKSVRPLERAYECVDHISYRFARPPARSLALPAGVGLKLDERTPDGRLVPPELLVRAYRAAAHRLSRDNGLQYRDPRGFPGIRRVIAEMLAAQHGLAVDERNICITRGSQNAIFLAGQILFERGDVVIVEELAYEPAIAAFRALGAHIVPVGLDEGGMKVEEIANICRRQSACAVFVTPHHQFPTTVSLRPERRLDLVDLARGFGFAIVEDDYDHEFHFGVRQRALGVDQPGA